MVGVNRCFNLKMRLVLCLRVLLNRPRIGSMSCMGPQHRPPDMGQTDGSATRCLLNLKNVWPQFARIHFRPPGIERGYLALLFLKLAERRFAKSFQLLFGLTKVSTDIEFRLSEMRLGFRKQRCKKAH